MFFLDNPQTQIACTTAVTTETGGVQILVCKEGFWNKCPDNTCSPWKGEKYFQAAWNVWKCLCLLMLEEGKVSFAYNLYFSYRVMYSRLNNDHFYLRDVHLS